jgi:UDP-N-acetylglucosamine 2-epimerase (non-hydrolysing)
MKTPKVTLILGTRPQIIKSSMIMYEALNQGLEIQIIHTGQHYESVLSQIFFKELFPSEPFANLNVGSGSHIYQIVEIMQRLEKPLTKNPSLVLIPGDTNSALAGALASVKLGLSVAHIESGARSYDMKMAEEINRRLIDHSAKLLFAPTENCKKNLKKESVTGKTYLTGDTMYDVFLKFQNKINQSTILNKLNLNNSEYALLTFHRAENVDNPTKLRNMIKALTNLKIKIVFPIHPRTRIRLIENGITIKNGNIQLIDPVGYFDMLRLINHARIVLTDSGGIQKEAFWSKTPCLTLRDRTEWKETVENGVNFITNVNAERIASKFEYIQNNYNEIKNRFKNNPFGEGDASKRIIKIIQDKLY